MILKGASSASPRFCASAVDLGFPITRDYGDHDDSGDRAHLNPLAPCTLVYQFAP